MKSFYKRKLCRRTSYATYVYENARQEMRDMTGSIANIKEEIAELEQQIGATFEKEVVLAFDMSLATKELITQTVQKRVN